MSKHPKYSSDEAEMWELIGAFSYHDQAKADRLKALITKEKAKAEMVGRKSELTKLKKMYEDYVPDRSKGQIAEDFGSAGAGIERQGLINYCKNRLAQLEAQLASEESTDA